MALVIEDGTGLTTSNSYATVDEAKAYALMRGIKLQKDSEVEVLLIKAMDYLHDQNFIGERRTKEQALDWPRINAVIECWPVDNDEIPRQLIQAQCALAVEAQSVDLLPTQDVNAKGPVIREAVAGAVDVGYANTGRIMSVPAMAKADALLRVLLKRNGLFAVRA